MDELLKLIHGRRGHFVFESGHHGNLWLDLELLCQRPDQLRPFARQLSKRLEQYEVDLICGPLVEGAFVGLMVAEELGAQFTYTIDRRTDTDELFPVVYELPKIWHARVTNQRVAICNDVINAGSAVRGAYADLQKHGANVVAVGTLLTLGTSADQFTAEWGVDLVTLSRQNSDLWEPDECPLCADNEPLDADLPRP